MDALFAFLLLLFEVPCCIVYGMLILFLLCQKYVQKNAVYQSAFFSMFLLNMVIDLMHITNNSVRTKLPLIPETRRFFEHDSVASTILFLSTFTAMAEMFGRVAIAAHRYLVMSSITSTEFLWDRHVVWVNLVIVGGPFAILSWMLGAEAHYIFTEDGNASVLYSDRSFEATTSIVVMSVYLVMMLASGGLNFASVVLYRRISKERGASTKDNRDLGLLLYSMVCFLLITARFLYELTCLIASVTKNLEYLHSAQDVQPFISTLYASLNGIFLLGISVHVRNDFLRFYKLGFLICRPNIVQIDCSNNEKEKVVV